MAVHPDDQNRRAATRPPDASGVSPAVLDQLKDQLWDFAQQTPEHAIIWADKDATVLWLNPGALAIFGTDLESAVGGPLAQFFTPEDVIMGIPEHERAVAKSYGAGDDHRWMMRSDGSRFWATGYLVAVRDQDGELMSFVKVLRDSTSLKMQIETLTNRAERSTTANEVMGRSMAIAAHELRNPLGAIALAATTVRMGMPDEASLQQPLDIIKRSVDLSVQLLDDLERGARVETGKLVLSVEQLNLRDVLLQGQHTATSRDRCSHKVQLLAPSAPIMFEGDRLRLQQVFANLIGNAMKFTGAGGDVWIKASVEGEQAVVRVEDNGIGIAPDMLGRIFDMFTQADSGTSDIGEGMGIGLAVVKRLVEAHGGSVQAKSDGVGKGSEFVVRLPLRHAVLAREADTP